MNYEITRVYRAVIDDVTRSLEEESVYTNIESSVIEELRRAWFERISEYTDLTKINELKESVAVHIDENGYIERNDDSNMDESISDSSESVYDEACDNYLMCLYVKVTKSKNKWKCSLKDGFINIGPLDFAFSTAQGDLYW